MCKCDEPKYDWNGECIYCGKLSSGSKAYLIFLVMLFAFLIIGFLL
jgi:hypothetical protein